MTDLFKRCLGLNVLMVLAAACSSPEPAAIIELSQQSDSANPTAVVIFVTPTNAPTAIPTVTLLQPSPTTTATPLPSATPDMLQAAALCEAQLTRLYTEASDVCLGKPEGYLCNGGLAPHAEPVGPISNQMAVIGALVETRFVDRVNPPPLPSNNSGGLMWLRLPQPLSVTALLVGDVDVTDVTPTDGYFPSWQSLQVITRQHNPADCATPRSALIIQGPYGAVGRIVINGISLDINGTVVVETEGNMTEFIALEGRTRLVMFGEGRVLYAGEQINIPYPVGDFTRPLSLPLSPQPLEFAHIRHLPITLLDRPVLLPQPGVVFTDGLVNMRAEPDEGARLLYQVPDDQPLSVLGKNVAGTWYHVRLGNNETGWMRSDLVVGMVGPIEMVYDPTPVPPQRYGDNATRATVIAITGGNLRVAPDVQFAAIDTLEAGTEVELLARSPYSPWVKVDTGGHIGWMALITLETQAVISFLPIDYDVPNPPSPTATPFLTFGGGHAYPDPRFGQ